MDMWVVYWSPIEYPGQYVARRWTPSPLPSIMVPTTDVRTGGLFLQRLREALVVEHNCTTSIPRSAGDDLSIVETWLVG